MLSISFKPHIKDKFYIEIENAAKELSIHPIDMINQLFNNINDKNYFIMIEGLEGTIENFVEEINSSNYVVIDNGKYKQLIKNLPTLYLITPYNKDIDVFKSYMGAFSEGFMSLNIINNSIGYVFPSDINKTAIIEFLNKNSVIEISITSDKNMLEIQSSRQEVLLNVCNRVCSCMLLGE